MFKANLIDRGSVEVPGGVALVYAHTSFRAATSFGGGGYAYGRPAAVRHEASGVEIPIRDHVMTVRLLCIALVIVTTMARWVYGR
jgi:hypothetical protein